VAYQGYVGQAGGSCAGVGRHGDGPLGHRIAHDVAIDDVADAPKDLSYDSEEPTGVDREPGTDAVARGDEEERGRAQEDRPEKGHAAIPDRDDVVRLQDKVLEQIGLLDDVVQPAANQTCDSRPEKHVPYLLVVNAKLHHVAEHHPERDADGDHVHQAIPVDGDWSHL